MTKRAIFFIISGSIIVIAAIAVSLFTLNIINPCETQLTVKDPHPVPWMLGGVVLDLGGPGDFDDKSIESPTLIQLADGSYAMWYRGQTYGDKIGRLMYAVSTDGITWIKKGVVMVPTEQYEGDKIDPMTVILENSVYKMWYGGQSHGGCACYATSPDGINWTKYPENPVLKKTSGNWDNEGAGGQHKVIKSGNTYIMYYKGYGDDNPGWVYYGRAESSDGVAWAKKGKALSPDPVLGESTALRNFAAFRLDGNYCIMYAMAGNLQLYLASSKDGKSYSKHGLVFPKAKTPGGFDVKWATSPCILTAGDTLKMWYEGGDINGRVRTLYAEINKTQFLKTLKTRVEALSSR
ncbi:MAG: hypothetical protein EHM12_00455 [Dehalococcoidia bacterium]|nr:MAG: hypothetical protein EHM12_00455 [Dehalococcoidia bacterium]